MKLFLNSPKVLIAISITSLLGACASPSTPSADAPKEEKTQGQKIAEESRAKHERPVSHQLGKFFEQDGKRMLYGGKQENQHFDITEYTLKDEQFHYGIGREAFPALITPEFMDVNKADEVFADTSRFLVLSKAGTTKAYSIKDLTRHEVVNDEINGEPIMAAYCILADLGAIYERTYDGKPFTFALSGYTYFDPQVWDGMDGFVLWDRETESLWWPLSGEAVSGKMKGSKLKVMDEQHWSQTTWSEVKANHPKAQVLVPNQPYTPPANWPRYADAKPDLGEQKSVAPKWGEN